MTTASTSSGTGIAAASAGTAAIGASDAYLSSGDEVKKPALRNIPLAVSAQTVVYNLPSLSPSSHVRLNGTLLAGIYDGTITMWNDPAITAVNPGLTLPALKIVPVHRNDSSGDTFLFTSYLSTQDASWNAKAGYGTTVSLAGGARRRAGEGQPQHAARLRGRPRLRRLQRHQLPGPRRRRAASAKPNSPTRPASTPCPTRPPSRPRSAPSCRSPRPARRSR